MIQEGWRKQDSAVFSSRVPCDEYLKVINNFIGALKFEEQGNSGVNSIRLTCHLFKCISVTRDCKDNL